jgi:hypothetical protein
LEAIVVALFGGAMVFALASTWIGDIVYGFVAWIGFSAIIFGIQRKYRPVGFVVMGVALLLVGLSALAIGLDITHSRLASIVIAVATMAAPFVVSHYVRKSRPLPWRVVTADFWHTLEESP